MDDGLLLIDEAGRITVDADGAAVDAFGKRVGRCIGGPAGGFITGCTGGVMMLVDGCWAEAGVIGAVESSSSSSNTKSGIKLCSLLLISSLKGVGLFRQSVNSSASGLSDGWSY